MVSMLGAVLASGDGVVDKNGLYFQRATVWGYRQTGKQIPKASADRERCMKENETKARGANENGANLVGWSGILQR